MTTGELKTIPARHGRAQRLSKGQSIKIINTHGAQVVDTWCFSAENLREFMSMEHMRPTLGRLWPRQGDALHSNRRRAILTIGGGYLARPARYDHRGLRRLPLRACWDAPNITTIAPTTWSPRCAISASK